MAAMDVPVVRSALVRAWVDLPGDLQRAAVSAVSVDWRSAVAEAAASATPSHRAAAAFAAIELPGVEVEGVLPGLLEDLDATVRQAALAALTEAARPARRNRITWPRVCAALAGAADGIDRHRLREVAALLVETWADPVVRAAATDALRAIMSDESHPVHLAARAAIRRLPPECIEIAVRHLSTRPWSAAARERVRPVGGGCAQRITPVLLMHPARAAVFGGRDGRSGPPRPSGEPERATDPWGVSAASRVLARRMLRAQPGGLIEEARRRLRDADLSVAAAGATWVRDAGAVRALAPDLCALAERAAAMEGGERAAACAAAALRDADDAASVDTLRGLLLHADGRIVSAAMESLARRAVRAGAWEGVRVDVRGAVDDPRHRVRATAIVLLGRVEPESARAPLVAMLHDGAAMHRVAAVWAAHRLLASGRLRPDAALWGSLAALAHTDPRGAIRARAEACLRALGFLRDQPACEASAAPQSL